MYTSPVDEKSFYLFSIHTTFLFGEGWQVAGRPTASSTTGGDSSRTVCRIGGDRYCLIINRTVFQVMLLSSTDHTTLSFQ
jgi:hypothetical protein